MIFNSNFFLSHLFDVANIKFAYEMRNVGKVSDDNKIFIRRNSKGFYALCPRHT